MYAQVEQTKDNENKRQGNEGNEIKRRKKQTSKFVDNRAKSVAQKKIYKFKNAGETVNQLKDITVGKGHDATIVKWREGRLKGSSDKVGLEMEAQNLHEENVNEGDLVGSAPKASAQNNLMKLLPTKPTLSSKNKYIKGHLLNHNVGGPGQDFNLFPITASANSAHHKFIEKAVKRWVLKENARIDYRVQVEVKDDGTEACKEKGGSVGAIFKCSANKKNGVGKTEASIKSIPNAKAEVSTGNVDFRQNDDETEAMFKNSSLIGVYFHEGVKEAEDPDELEELREQTAQEIFSNIVEKVELTKKVVAGIRGKTPTNISSKMCKEIKDLIIDILIVFAELMDTDREREYKEDHRELIEYLTGI